jgi:hypothetical protein
MPKHAPRDWNAADEEATRVVSPQETRVVSGDTAEYQPVPPARQQSQAASDVPVTQTMRRAPQQQAYQQQGQYGGQPYQQQQQYQAQYQHPYGQQPGYQQAYRPNVAPVESPAQQPFSPNAQAAQREPVRRGGAGAAWLLKLIAVVLRLCAIALAALVVANAFNIGPLRIRLVEITSTVASWIPDGLSGSLVYQTPFGGVLRGDFVAVAVAFFIVDWLLSRKARELRDR